MSNRNTCNSCAARITWARTSMGKAIPLDPEPCPDGNLVLEVEDPRDAPLAVAASRAGPEVPRWRSHFASCPNAAQHLVKRASATPRARRQEP